MKSRILIAATIAIAISAGAFADAGKHADWAKGPVQFLMTTDEAARWKAIKTESEAEEFINLFWARRDPSPRTPQNEFKDQFEAVVKVADERFSTRRVKGSLTERGKVFVTLGAPTRIERSGGPTGAPSPSSPNQGDTEVVQDWIYDGEVSQRLFGQTRADVRFVDRFGNGDFKLERTAVDVPAAQQRRIATFIVNPDLTKAPDFTAAARPVAPAAPAAPQVLTEFRTPAFQTAVTEFKAKGTPAKPISVAWGEFVTGQGDYFVPVSLSVPKSAGLTPEQKLTFFGLVEDETGKVVAVFEEPATLTASREDLFFDKSLTLPAGKHRAVFGLAENGTPITMVSTNMELAGSLDAKAEGVSRLLLSNNIYPLSAAQHPTEPFAFGGMKVVPKADQTFTTADDLWYFIEIRNPGIAEVEGAPGAPKIQAKIDLEGEADEPNKQGQKKIKMTQPLSEIQATEFKGLAGHYGIGSAIPLASFRPGKYTMTVKLIDSVTKANYTVKEDFRVVAAPKTTP